MASRNLFATCIAVLTAITLAAPSQALAVFGLNGLGAAPADTQAGANSNFTIQMAFDGSTAAESVRDLTIHLPPGQVGNPTAAPLCGVGQLNANACPADTQVGAVTANATIGMLLPADIPGAIYNLEPQPGEPARFGIVLEPPLLDPIILQSAAKLRQSDFGLDTVLTDLPNDTGPPLNLGVHINSQQITLFGTAGNPPQGFIRNPTSCGTATTGFDATSHSDETASGQASYTPTGCENLAFSPTLTATVGAPGQTGIGSRPPLTTVIEQGIEEAGLRRAEVLLPAGIGADNAELAQQCPNTDFAAGSCPANTIVGSAQAASPLLADPLTGTVAIVQSDPPGALPQLGLDLSGALSLKLRGSFVLSPSAGNVFEGLPDIPISRFELKFDQGKLITSSRDMCVGDPMLFHTNFEAHSGALQSGDVAASVVGCAPSAPTAEVKLSRARSDHPRLRLTAVAGSPQLAAVKLRLPKQLRFGSDSEVEDGTKASGDGHKLPDSALGGGHRALKLKPNGAGVEELVARVGGEAVDRLRRIAAGHTLRFPVKLTASNGEVTRLVVKAEAKK